MPRHRADHEGVALLANAGQFGNATQVDERAGLRQSELHRRNETLPARERLAARARERLGGVGERFRKLVFECVHEFLLRPWHPESPATRDAAMPAYRDA